MTTKAGRIISTDLESLEFCKFFDVGLTKFKNNQNLLLKTSHRYLLTTKPFTLWKILIRKQASTIIINSTLHINTILCRYTERANMHCCLQWFWNCSGMVLVWFWHGSGMGLVWFWHGSGMVLAWFWHGSGMVLAWFWRGSGVVLAWLWHGSGVVLAWFWHGFNISYNVYLYI